MKQLLKTAYGQFVFENGVLLDSGDAATQKHSNAQEVTLSTIEQPHKVLAALRSQVSSQELIAASLVAVKQSIRHSVKEDTHIIQAIKNIDDLDRVANLLSKRLREWYGYYSPELEASIEDHQEFVIAVQESSRAELLKKLNLEESQSMGGRCSEEVLSQMRSLASQIAHLYQERTTRIEFIEAQMQAHCPNMCALCGALVGARLINSAGSLARIARLPASTIQTLGAEKALFRHMVSNARPPKHGILIHHPLVNQAARKDRGRVARALANKIAIAAKLDFFGGDQLMGYSLLEQLEKKFGGAQ